MGMSAAVIVGLCIVLGLWGDATWHTSPALLLVGLALGVVLAAVMVVQQIREYL
ncbi:MAG TPA: AtpZ/AtpI family protein [Acidimicrobiales bacterium]|jgi:F0F1-type ATP synthase assembly protein I